MYKDMHTSIPEATINPHGMGPHNAPTRRLAALVLCLLVGAVCASWCGCVAFRRSIACSTFDNLLTQVIYNQETDYRTSQAPPTNACVYVSSTSTLFTFECFEIAAVAINAARC